MKAPHPVVAMLVARPGRLVLASASPRRHELLGRVGLDPVVEPAEVDETPVPGESPVTLVQRLAIAKATAGARRRPASDIVIGGDTVVALDDTVLGKPHDRDEAATMLAGLAGRTHHVHSGVAVATGTIMRSVVATTAVSLMSLSTATVEWYLDTGEWQGKAGGYAIQGAAAAFVTGLEGLDTTVIGLPLGPTLSLLTDVLDARVAASGLGSVSGVAGLRRVAWRTVESS